MKEPSSPVRRSATPASLLKQIAMSIFFSGPKKQIALGRLAVLVGADERSQKHFRQYRTLKFQVPDPASFFRRTLLKASAACFLEHPAAACGVLRCVAGECRVLDCQKRWSGKNRDRSLLFWKTKTKTREIRPRTHVRDQSFSAVPPCLATSLDVFTTNLRIPSRDLERNGGKSCRKSWGVLRLRYPGHSVSDFQHLGGVTGQASLDGWEKCISNS